MDLHLLVGRTAGPGRCGVVLLALEGQPGAYPARRPGHDPLGAVLHALVPEQSPRRTSRVPGGRGRRARCRTRRGGVTVIPHRARRVCTAPRPSRPRPPTKSTRASARSTRASRQVEPGLPARSTRASRLVDPGLAPGRAAPAAWLTLASLSGEPGLAPARVRLLTGPRLVELVETTRNPPRAGTVTAGDRGGRGSVARLADSRRRSRRGRPQMLLRLSILSAVTSRIEHMIEDQSAEVSAGVLPDPALPDSRVLAGWVRALASLGDPGQPPGQHRRLRRHRLVRPTPVSCRMRSGWSSSRCWSG